MVEHFECKTYLCRRTNGFYYLKIRYGERGSIQEKRPSLKTKNKREAEKLAKVFEKRFREGAIVSRPASKDVTPEDLLDAWRPWAEKHLTSNSRKFQEGNFLRFFDILKSQIGRKRKTLGAVKQKDVLDVTLWMANNGYAKSTINSYLRDVSRLYGHASKTFGLYKGHNPTEGVKRFKLAQVPPPVLSVEEAQNLLEVAKDFDRTRPDEPRMEWFMVLCLHAGLRKAEAVNSKWEWFDWKNKTLMVPSMEGEFTTKSGKSRTIPLDDRIIEAIKRHKQKEGYLFDSGKKAEEDRIGPYRYTVNKPFDTVCRTAGIATINHFGSKKKTTPHVLRYTFGSLRVEAGVPMAKVSKWLGHSSVRVTERHYIHLSDGYDPDINLN